MAGEGPKRIPDQRGRGPSRRQQRPAALGRPNGRPLTSQSPASRSFVTSLLHIKLSGNETQESR